MIVGAILGECRLMAQGAGLVRSAVWSLLSEKRTSCDYVELTGRRKWHRRAPHPEAMPVHDIPAL